MANSRKSIKKKINLGTNLEYDKAIGKLYKNYSSQSAVKLGKLFREETFKNMNVDTFIKNVADMFVFFKNRNKGILKKDEAYISEDDIIDLIRRYPRIVSQNTRELLQQREEILENISDMNQKDINLVFKNSNGYLYSIGEKKIFQTLTFLDELTVLDEKNEQQSASQYLLTQLGEKNLQMGSEKVFQRLLHIVTTAKTKVIPKKDFNFCFKRSDIQYQERYGKSQEQLNEIYILPKTEDRKEYQEQIQSIVERQASKKEIQKGEE